jgi:hypothetical protein
MRSRENGEGGEDVDKLSSVYALLLKPILLSDEMTLEPGFVLRLIF